MAGIGFVSLRDPTVEKDQKKWLDNTFLYRSKVLSYIDCRKIPQESLDCDLESNYLNYTLIISDIESPGL